MAFGQAVALGAAIDYLQGIGMKAVREHERELTAYALDRLEEAGVTIFGPRDPDRRGGAVSFWYRDIHPHDLATVLDQEGVAIRAGHHCAMILMRRLGVPATARASFYLYTTTEDVDRLIEALGKAEEVFG
jgi:cysteine desulfurase/selenocysteine lyase